MTDFIPLTADEIDNVEDTIIEVHPVPEWGEGRGVYVRSISAAERGQIEGDAALFKESKGKDRSFAQNFTIKMAWMGMCNEKGERLYSKPADIARLRKRNASAIAKIAEHVQRLSGFSEKDVELLEKNLSETQRSDMATD